MISREVPGARGLATADLDGDGYVDVLASSEYEGQVYWFRNLPDAGFGDAVLISDKLTSTLTVYAADLTGDGAADVVVGGETTVMWFENRGDGTFEKAEIIADEVPKIIRLTAADLDADGDLDLLSASRGKVAWHENLGAGRFRDLKILNLGVEHVNWVHSADLNGDDRPDVMAVSYEREYSEIDEDPARRNRAARDDRLLWHANQGDGAFGPAQVVYGRPAIIQSHATSGDLDGDGRQDLISCLFYIDQIVWFRNLGGARFGEPRLIADDVDAPEALVVADFDADGDEDVASASLFDGRFAIYVNAGEGKFNRRVELARDVQGAIAIEAADIDKDGDLDLVGAAESEGSVFWFENFSE